MIFAVFDVFASYSSALHTSLAHVQGFSLMVTKHSSTALKVNGMTEDISFVVLFRPKKFFIWSSDSEIFVSGHPYAARRSHLKRRFYLDKDFVYNFQDAKVFRIWIKSHEGAVE